MRKASCYCAVLLLLMFGISVCNSTATGLYPNITLQGTGTPEITPVNTLFIYNWTVQEQARRPVYVKAFEYCFQKTITTPVRPVFTFLLLEPVTTGYMVVLKVDVMTRDFSSCSNRRGIDVCCGRRSLDQADIFQVLTPTSRAFGIYATGSNRILGSDPALVDSTVGLQIPLDRKDDKFINTNAPLTTVNYRLFNMVIDNVSMAEVPTSKTVHSSNTSNGMGTHPQMPWTETTLTTPTDGEATNIPDGTSTDSLSVMVLVEIALGCFILVLFSGSIGLWVLLCYKARAMQRGRNTQRRNRNELERSHQPVYDSVDIYKLHRSTSGNGPLIEFFHRNPAYAYHGTQLEPQPCKKIGKIHHDWLI